MADFIDENTQLSPANRAQVRPSGNARGDAKMASLLWRKAEQTAATLRSKKPLGATGCRKGKRRDLLIAVVKDPARDVIKLLTGKTRHKGGAIRCMHTKFRRIRVAVKPVGKEDNFRIVEFRLRQRIDRRFALLYAAIECQPLLRRFYMRRDGFAQR